MTGTFSYAPELLSGFAKAAKRRRNLGILFCLPFWIVGIGSGYAEGDALGLLIALGASVIIASFGKALCKFESATRDLGETVIEYDGARGLSQLGSERRLSAKIDLSQPYRVTQPFGNIGGNAIYHVFQPPEADGPALVFSSRIDGAERLVREILRQDEWPPGNNAS